MKNIVLCGPGKNLKTYAVCLSDTEKNGLTTLLFLVPSTTIDDATYHELVKELKISCRQDYEPKLKETTDEAQTIKE